MKIIPVRNHGNLISAVIWPIIILLVVLAAIIYLLLKVFALPERELPPDQSPAPRIEQFTPWPANPDTNNPEND